MCPVQRCANLNRVAERFLRRQAAFRQPVRKRSAFDRFVGVKFQFLRAHVSHVFLDADLPVMLLNARQTVPVITILLSAERLYNEGTGSFGFCMYQGPSKVNRWYVLC